MGSDKISLATCSLLSRRWHLCALPSLFQNLTIHVQETKRNHPFEHFGHSLDAFAAFLASDDASSKVLATYVRHLRVVGGGTKDVSYPLLPSRAHGTDEAVDNPRRRVTVESFAPIFAKLDLESFSSTGVLFSSCSPTALDMCRSRYPTVKSLQHLTLEDTCMYPPAADDKEALAKCPLVQFLNMFAEVLEFEICDVFFSFDTAGLFYPDATFDSLYYASYWDDPANALTAASNITGTSHVERFSAKLKVMAANEDVLEILRLSTVLCHTLRHLEISSERGSTFREILQKVGHHLTHLHVSLEYYPRRWDDEADYFGVSQCTRLSTFHITVYAALHNVEFQLPFVCDDVTNIVFHLPTSISKFKIELICETSYEGCDSESYLRGLPWEDIETQLCSRHIADVKVEFTNRYNDDGVNFNTEIELAKEFLPRLRDLNVLTVCGPDEEVTS